MESLQQAERHRDPGRRKLLSYRFGQDPDLFVLCLKMWAPMFLALHEQAAGVGDQVRAELAGHGHAPTVAICTFYAVVWPELLFGDLEACERHSAELVAYCAEKKVEQIRLLSACV